MKKPRIWESASRPLFVRTVWLESSELRRGLQRHFLWNYETKTPLERLDSAINPVQQKGKEISFELNELTDLDDLNNIEEEAFLIGSAKLKLHEPSKLFGGKTTNLLKFPRRSSLFRRKYSSYESYQPSKNISRRSSDISESYSRKNSLQNLGNETEDERLAERVLHWLDLAGKEKSFKNLHDLKGMEVRLSKTTKLRQDSIKRYHNKLQNSQGNITHKTKNAQRITSTPQGNQKGCKSIKHITIIFNKEGQPIRFNRPAKNIDLCELSTSRSTTRRLAGTLASDRLYKSEKNNKCVKTTYPKTKGNECNKFLSTRSRRLDTVADLTNSTLQKRLHEKSLQDSYNNLNYCKKQLHIFMPTLLKKGLTKTTNTNYGMEDAGMSELSYNFNELCRI